MLESNTNKEAKGKLCTSTSNHVTEKEQKKYWSHLHESDDPSDENKIWLVAA